MGCNSKLDENCHTFQEYSKLKDMTSKIGSGATPKGGKKNYKDKGIPFIRSQNVYNLYFDYDGLVYIDDGQAQKLDNVELSENDILLNITGDSVARCCKLPPKLAGGRVNQHVAIIRTNEDKLISDYLLYSLVNPSMQEFMLSIARSGGTRAALTKGMIESFELNIPSVNEQTAIAHILSTLDEKIDTNNRINQVLEEMAQLLFKHWFVDFEFPTEEGVPYKSSGGEMMESEMGLIPKGWKVNSIGNITKIIRGASPRPIQDYLRTEGMPWVKISDATSCTSKFLLETKEYIKHEGVSKSRRVLPGTLMLSNSATPGIPKIILIEACVHDGWLIFNEYKVLPKEYIYYLLLHEREKILQLSNGSVFRNLKTDILKKYQVVVPDPITVKKICKLLRTFDITIEKNVREIDSIQTLRDTLLPKLMSGEIRVPCEEDELSDIAGSQ